MTKAVGIDLGTTNSVVAGTMTTETEPAELERLKQELDHEHEMHLRALADFDNYRRRTERDRATATARGKRDIVLSLLELMDSFERALPHLTQSAASDGVRAIHRQLMGILERQGVAPIEAVGETFNPELHEAIGLDPSDDQEPGTVTAELQRGYLWSDGLLRPARVRVAQ
jgi:molecular chaperone GrpE